jgi:hypothetical protein
MSYGWRDVDGTFVEVCDECGFDARTVDDEGASFEAVFTALDELVAHENAERKPSEEIWSAREYVTHCIEVTEAILGYVTDRLGDEPAACPDLDTSRAAVAARRASLTAEDRAAVIEDVYPFPVTVQWVLSHLLHDLEHHVLDIRRGYAGFVLADSDGPTAQR